MEYYKHEGKARVSVRIIQYLNKLQIMFLEAFKSRNSELSLCFNCCNLLFFIFRIRCPEEGGHYCVKKVQEKAGARVTLRGCMGPGPIVTENNESIRLKEGCVSYRQGGYSTTSCLCSKDMCNTAPRIIEGTLHAYSLPACPPSSFTSACWPYKVRKY